MDGTTKRRLLIGGGVAAALLAGWLIVRRLTSNYTSISSAMNAVIGNYFTISELCASATATDKGIDNTPTEAVKANLTLLINNVLNPIRAAYGKPIRVSSGYRCAKLNAAVGGVANSQHLTGCAADLVPTSGGSLADIFRAAVKCGCYDQLIIEHKNSTHWVHVSYSPSPRRQMLAYVNGGFVGITTANFEKYLNA